MKYRVVVVTNNLKDYPHRRQDTEEFPELIYYIEDEEAVFVVDEVRGFWPAEEFFLMNDIKCFYTPL